MTENDAQHVTLSVGTALGGHDDGRIAFQEIAERVKSAACGCPQATRYDQAEFPSGVSITLRLPSGEMCVIAAHRVGVFALAMCFRVVEWSPSPSRCDSVVTD
jgi:hypothetical protein